MNYHIEKNTVQETLIIPLYGRKMCTELFPDLYKDETAARLIKQIDYDFTEIDKKANSKMQQFGFLEVAMRHYDLSYEVKEYLKSHPKAAMVNLGCGLDTTGNYCDNGQCKLYNLDLPDVIAIRNELLPAGDREKNIPCDLTDPSWFDEIDASEGAVFFAAGVIFYLLTDQVKALIQNMAERFQGCRFVFDAMGKTALNIMMGTWVKEAGITDLDAYFYVSDTKEELSEYAEGIDVSSRGFLLGYKDLPRSEIGGFFRFLCKLGDNTLKMQIVKIEF